MPKPTKLKVVNEDNKIYHAFPYNKVSYAIYDWEMDMPIQYASVTTIGPTVRSLKKNIENFYIIFYKISSTDKSFIIDKSTTNRYNQ